MRNDLAALQGKLKITFKNPSLLEQALVHSSYVNENPTKTKSSNERLEFLGDAILGLVIGEKLYRDFPGYAEGELTRLRSVLVQRDALSRVAESINLGVYLYLGKGEEATGGRRKSANLAGAMEAVIAAVYLDRGLVVVGKLVERLLAAEIEAAFGNSSIEDYKSKLQALIQSRLKQTPVYETVKAEGPDHDRKFTVEVKVGGRVAGKGAGRSKRIAEAEAARLALEKLNKNFTL